MFNKYFQKNLNFLTVFVYYFLLLNSSYFNCECLLIMIFSFILGQLLLSMARLAIGPRR